ncbi:MAG: hypothetical protein SGARI_004659, partial [Bacillariaceae sp.]
MWPFPEKAAVADDDNAHNISFADGEIAANNNNNHHRDAAATSTSTSAVATPTPYISKTVILDVGGQTFKTTRASLGRVPGSFFEAMVSGRHLHPTAAATAEGATGSNNNEFFVDRDPTHFRHILNYLRTGAVVTLPKADEDREELVIEADFYGLTDLVRALKYPALDVTDFLPAQVVDFQQEERKMRKRLRKMSFAHLPRGEPHEKMICLLGKDQDGTMSLP